MKIEDYALIGDLHTAALVGRNGSIDWLCLPRFDAPACFAALLGTAENGSWSLQPTGDFTVARRYLDESLVLETVYTTAAGRARVLDFMPPGTGHRHVIRRIEGLSGTVEFHTRIILRFDYGRTVPWVQHSADGGIVAVAGPRAAAVRSRLRLRGEGLTTTAVFSVSAGGSESFVLTDFPSHETAPESIHASGLLEQTLSFWQSWAQRCRYRGKWRAQVVRSLITLKALTYTPTGGIVAAATTSLPEQLGGIRNWDYRYCWLRDATFTLYSFMTQGYLDEARDWANWLLRAVAGDPAQLQIMYGVAGERSLPEMEIPHLPGYENSKPVRIGNAAAAQFQLDVFGELMDAMHVARSVGLKTDEASWRLETHLIDFVVQNWQRPDEGIWEMRGPRRHFTHSKIMAWVALDRGIKSIEQFNLAGDKTRWEAVRAAIHDDVCQQGFNPETGTFTQYYGGRSLDASLLLIPMVGFLPVADARVQATVDAIQRDLMHDGFVRRYLTDTSVVVDGLPGDEGTFLPCSFWLTDCLHLMGRSKEALELYERLLLTTNDLGLLAEEYDPRARRLLGNFPQAFSHIALINTAANLTPRIEGPAETRSRT